MSVNLLFFAVLFYQTSNRMYLVTLPSFAQFFRGAKCAKFDFDFQPHSPLSRFHFQTEQEI